MWILPKQLHTSAFVPDTEALISDLNEQSQLCAQSLLARSKPSLARTWSQKWKRDSWTRHLSGRILKPSHGPSFVTAWTSSLAATRASRSAQPASDSAPKTHDTSGRTYQPELLSCDQVSVSLKTSRDISALGYPTCCKTWSDWVTNRRSAWQARLKSARRTSGSGCSSWPTVTANEDSYRIGGESQQSKCLSAMARRGEMHGQAAPANWPTPNCMDVITPTRDLTSMESKGHWGKGMNTGKLSEMVNYGQAAPASSSSGGSRQGWWRTPNAQLIEAKPPGTKLTGRTPKVETLFTKDGAPAMPGQRAYRRTPSGKLVLQSQTINQQVEMVENWATPQAHDAQGPKTPEQIEAMRAKGHGVKNLNEQAAWGTPTARDHKSGRGNNEREYKELTPLVARQQSGKLNPRWVETLMGLPVGWVMPSCASPVTIAPTSCDCSETESCRPPQSGLLEFFLAS